MPLSPETLDALKQALDAVVQECGDDPEYGELVGSLTDAQGALDGLDGGEGAKAEGPERDSDEDEFSFENARKKHTESRKGRQAKADDEDAEL